MINMFLQTWAKYIPIIRILFKRSVKEQQVLDMNSSDFLRASGGKKIKLTFSVTLHKGRLQNIDSPAPPLARDLVLALQNDPVTGPFIKANDLELSMNKNYQLVIKNTGAPSATTETKESDDLPIEETSTVNGSDNGTSNEDTDE